MARPSAINGLSSYSANKNCALTWLSEDGISLNAEVFLGFVILRGREE